MSLEIQVFFQAGGSLCNNNAKKGVEKCWQKCWQRFEAVFILQLLQPLSIYNALEEKLEFLGKAPYGSELWESSLDRLAIAEPFIPISS